jgi:hypothetical protein
VVVVRWDQELLVSVRSALKVFWQRRWWLAEVVFGCCPGVPERARYVDTPC